MFDTMSDETNTVRIRALKTVGQLNLYYSQEGDFPVDVAQPFLDRGVVEKVTADKPKRRTRKSSDTGPTDDDGPVTDNE